MRKVITDSEVNRMVEEAKQAGTPYKCYTDALAALRTQMYADMTVQLAVLPEVKYDSKTDRYVIHFQTSGDRKHSAKATEEAAEFLLSVLTDSSATYRLFAFKMEKGVIVDVVAEAY